MNKQFMFDLSQTSMTDLASDLDQFNSFYSKGSTTHKIERPENPHIKNFQSYKQTHSSGSPLPFAAPQQRNSFCVSLRRIENELSSIGSSPFSM
jgi:hypothetical protein